MAILKIQELKTTIKAKGMVTAIDDVGVHIINPKTEEEATLTLDVFKCFIGKEINFSVSESAKSEEDFDVEEEVEEEEESKNDYIKKGKIKVWQKKLKCQKVNLKLQELLTE